MNPLKDSRMDQLIDTAFNYRKDYPSCSSMLFFFHFEVSFTRGNCGLIPRDISLEKVFGSMARRGKKRKKKVGILKKRGCWVLTEWTMSSEGISFEGKRDWG